ncbi:DEP1A protein, partial [Amia calva]|nr:DEP1A protein [Amia calva]
MPLRRHWVHFRSHDGCFSASEAVDWLHGLLKGNHNFGPDVTRAQTVQLLKKFLKNHVIEDIKGRWGKEDFEDNGTLYRFPPSSPLKPVPKRPLHTENIFIPKFPNWDDYEETAARDNVHSAELWNKRHSIAIGEVHECKLIRRREITPRHVEHIWKSMTLAHLQKILGLKSLDGVLDTKLLKAKNILHNVYQVNKQGVVVLEDKLEELPHWVLSAMKCLANWPNGSELKQPMYPGFEKDVFKTVADYFQKLKEPLLTFQLYDVFVNILALSGLIVLPRPIGHRKETVEPPLRVRQHPAAEGPNHMPGSCVSVENLILGMARQGNIEEESSTHAVHRPSSVWNAKTDRPGREVLREVPRCTYSRSPHSESSRPLLISADQRGRRRSLQNSGMKINAGNSVQNLWDLRDASLNPWVSTYRHCSEESLYRAETREIGLFGSIFPATPELCRRAAGKENPVRGTGAVLQRMRSVRCMPSRSSAGVAVAGGSPCSCCNSSAGGGEPVALRNNQTKLERVTLDSDTEGAFNKPVLPPQSGVLQKQHVATEALQVCCLLLPPENRRKLQLLMRLIGRIFMNKKIPPLNNAIGTRTLMVQTFSRCILCSADEVDLDELLATKLVTFMMDNYEEILKVPGRLQKSVEDHLAHLRRVQIKYAGADAEASFVSHSYCKQISKEEFEEQRVSSARAPMAELLEGIIQDTELPAKDKKKKLKQFQKSYPDIYRKRLPTAESEAAVFPVKPKMKPQLMFFTLKKPFQPFQRTRSFRA